MYFEWQHTRDGWDVTLNWGGRNEDGNPGCEYHVTLSPAEIVRLFAELCERNGSAARVRGTLASDVSPRWAQGYGAAIEEVGLTALLSEPEVRDE